ncbi:antibiotic biosynthesis monooxygenase family protein [Streptomyces sp. NPDC048438]|uniref:antibiotic biosynthesis monooxygenase family protein n=1 Tax=Streptomyces sp. NPDC048438 TaxID=3365551 RepID=UPI003717410B
MTSDVEGRPGVTFGELDPGQGFATQMSLNGGPCTLLDILVIPPGGQEEVIERWRQHAEYMLGRPGCISTQMHRALGEGGTLVNLAVWDSPSALLAAVTAPEFAAIASDYPPGTSCTRQLLSKVAVEGICVA